MPTSDYHHLTDVLHVLEQLRPASLLEIGIGHGKWGVMCRDALETLQGKLSPEAWTTRIDGIEIFERYRNPLWAYAYNQVRVGDALTLVRDLPHYDVILCSDVIEHVPQPQGLAFVRALLEHAEIVILTTPRGDFPQPALGGNPHEEHVSRWAIRDFSAIPHQAKVIGCTFLVVLARDARSLKRVDLWHPLDVRGVRGYLLELGRYLVWRLTWRFRARA